MKTNLLFLLMALLIICGGCACLRLSDKIICQDYSDKTISKLPVNLIYDMVGLYSPRQSAINPNFTMEDARAVWFDLETLKKFLYHIEYTAKKMDDKVKTEDLGVRVYYARYPRKEYWENKYGGILKGFHHDQKTQEYGMKHTLIMVPTIRGETTDMDFNPIDRGTYKTGLPDFSSIQRYDQHVSAIVPLPESPKTPLEYSGSQNHGGLFPPGESDGLSFINY